MSGRYEAVYILYPRGVRTGGPEALHQLAAALRKLGTLAFLVPLPHTESKARVTDYEKYAVPEAETVLDLPGNAVVAPEGHYFELTKYRRAERFCWWLSIDFSQLYRSGRRLTSMPASGLKNRIHRPAHRVIASWEAAMRPLALRLPVYHLTQSAYAWTFLYSRAGVLPSMLSDYISLPTDHAGIEAVRKPRQIAYNFARGGDLVQQVIESMTVDAAWLPIAGMSRTEVIYALQSSAVYLDLGHQPGKDRLPREAAASGAVTIVARRGAGGFHLDFPIPYEHKITIGDGLITSVSGTINAVLNNLDCEYDRQANFRHEISCEQQVFMREVTRVFIEGKFGSDFEYDREL
jgi:hypothetical protein